MTGLSLGRVFLIGLTISIATVIRPIGYYLIFIFFFMILIFSIRERIEKKKIFQSAIILFIPWIVIVGGWQARNHYHTGSWQLTDSQGIMLLYYGAAVKADIEDIGFEIARKELINEISEGRELTPAERSSLSSQKGLELVKKHPNIFIKSQVLSLAKLMFASSVPHFLRFVDCELESGPFGDAFRLSINEYIEKWVVGKPIILSLFIFEKIFLLSFYLGLSISIFYFLLRFKNIHPSRIIIFGLIFYFLLVSWGPWGNARFRVALMPLCAIESAYGLSIIYFHIIKLWNSIRNKIGS